MSTRHSSHETFSFRSLDELRARIDKMALALPLSSELDILGKPLTLGRLTPANRLVVHPMEGADAEPDGSPSELTRRRYRRLAAGGAGLLWLEACAVVAEGKANPRQLHITEANAPAFASLVAEIRQTSQESLGGRHGPALILQLTHSGRYSRPFGRPTPIIGCHNPVFDAGQSLPPDYPLICDEELDRLQEAYVHAAILAAKAGVDGIDVKCCHGYLLSELLASRTRDPSRYGGGFENRVRFVLETMARIRDAVPQLELACRLNVFDAMAGGFGVDATNPAKADLAEPVELVRRLSLLGVRLLNITVGDPYHRPHFGRPYDQPIEGGTLPDEHPLEGIERLVTLGRDIQQACPSVGLVGTGYSWLRHLFPFLAAGVLAKGWATLVGVGRLAIAYPDFAKDLLATGRLDPAKCCVACSACTQIMRDGGTTGCVVRDPEIYGPIFREGRRRYQKK